MLPSLAVSLLLAAPPRIAVMPVVAGEGIAAPTAAALTDALAAEVRKRAGADVITQREIASVLSLEQQRSMLGCPSDVCAAELGGALGVERIVASDLSRLGESLLVHLRLLDVAKVKVLAQADRRLRGGTLDDLLDALPAVAGELFGAPGAGLSAAPEPGPPPAASRAPVASWVEEPLDLPPEQRGQLDFFADAAGRVLALPYSKVPYERWMEGPVYFGGGGKLFRVRIRGGGASTDDKRLDRTFWEPRDRRGVGGSLALRPGSTTVECPGGKPAPLAPLSAEEAKRLARGARFFAPPWRRIPKALARDDDGGYWLVDGARTAEGDAAEEPDLRLWLGRKGSLVRVDLLDAAVDGGGELYTARSGRLKVARTGREVQAEWLTPGGSKALTWLEPSDHGRLIYLELGAYGPAPALGTPCDPPPAAAR